MSFRLAAALLLSVFAVPGWGETAPSYRPTKGSEILWDRHGVPHVFAKTVPDMFYLFGYAEVEAHGNLLLRTLGQSRGRGAEYFGPGHQDVRIKTDRWIWMNEVPQRSRQWLALQKPDFRKYLDAFAAGINAAAMKASGLDPEVKQVLPVTALDIVQHEHHFYNFQFVANRSLMDPPANSRSGAVATVAQWNEFDADDAADGSNGSNGWAVGPGKSASGKSMLLMNPHLAWGGEQTYFEIHLSAPGINLYGATQIGVPALRFVMSDRHAITNTVNTNRGRLLFAIKEADGGYMFDGKVRPYEKASYPIKIRQADGSMRTESVDVLKTVHGPVIRRDKGIPVAMYVAGLDKPYLLEQVYRMSIAKSFAEYEEQLKRQQIPMYNILYADKEGHIHYLFNASIPKRTEGDWTFWGGVVAGDTSRLLPQGILSYDELPKLLDPPSGYVQNANEPPWDAGWPTMLNPRGYAPYIAPQGSTFRADRSLRMLSEDPKMSFEMLLQKKLSTRAEAADRLLPDLLAAVDQFGSERAKRAAAVLRAWDRQAEESSRGTLLFWNWATRFGMPGVEVSKGNFAVLRELDKPLTTPAGLVNPKAAAEMLDAAAEEIEKKYGALDKPWGEFLRLQINAQSAGAAAAAERGAPLNGVDLAGNGGPGAIGIFRVITPGPVQNGTSTPVHGDGFTLAVEFANPVKAKALVSYGTCSQPGCAHHTDELPLFAKKQWREVWRTRAEVEKNLERRETF